MSSSVKRACDACHRRKVKCDGRSPCRNCRQASLTCTFDAVPQKKGPKGSRAKVISELRETQRQTNLALKLQRQYLSFDNLSGPSQSPNPAFGLLTPEIIHGCIDFFFENMYPTMPILHRERLEEHVQAMDVSAESYCLISSLCAFMIIQPGITIPPNLLEYTDAPVSNLDMGTALVEETLRVRRSYDYIEMPTTKAVITSFFLFACYFGLNKHNTAWFHLREATTLSQILGMQDENTYVSEDLIESSRKRRLFWLLFVTERAYALQRHRPLTLHSTIALPTVTEDPSETIAISGFLHLVDLFRPFDDIFVGLWNKARSDCSTTWLAQLQKQLSDALPAQLSSTESQAADLRISQQWLRTMVWQLSMSNGFLSSASADSSMKFKYPLEIARDLVALTGQLSQQSMEVHGIGLIWKIFDIACTLTDVMSCVPLDNNTFEFGPRDYLDRCLNLVSTLRGGDSRYLPLLLEKINNTLPAMAAPLPAPLPLDYVDGRVEEVYDGLVEEVYDGSTTDHSSILENQSSFLGSPALHSSVTDHSSILGSPPMPPTSTDGYTSFAPITPNPPMLPNLPQFSENHAIPLQYGYPSRAHFSVDA